MVALFRIHLSLVFLKGVLWAATYRGYALIIRIQVSIKWGEEGLRLKRESDIDTGVDPSHSLHLAKRDSGHTQEALTFFCQGKKINDILLAPDASKKNDAPFFGNIGRCIHLLGDPQKALRFYVISANILVNGQKNALNLMNLGWASLWIGQACIDLEDWNNAKLFLSQCLDIWQKRAPLQLELLIEQKNRLPLGGSLLSTHEQELTIDLCNKQIAIWLKD